MSDMDLSDCGESEDHQLEEGAVDAAFHCHDPVQQALQQREKDVAAAAAQQALQQREADAAAAAAASAAGAESEEDCDSDAIHSDDGGSEGGSRTDEAAAAVDPVCAVCQNDDPSVCDFQRCDGGCHRWFCIEGMCASALGIAFDKYLSVGDLVCANCALLEKKLQVNVLTTMPDMWLPASDDA